MLELLLIFVIILSLFCFARKKENKKWPLNKFLQFTFCFSRFFHAIYKRGDGKQRWG